jgi:hypothetical protein
MWAMAMLVPFQQKNLINFFWIWHQHGGWLQIENQQRPPEKQGFGFLPNCRVLASPYTVRLTDSSQLK